MTLPAYFCWTRFGTEAGQAIGQIFERKEQERVANGGIFFWGIGNAVGPSIRELLRRTENPEVLFSPIKSAPRTADAEPPAVAAWTTAETLGGEPFRLPCQSLVTSRYDPSSPKQASYALVCFSPRPLYETQCEEQILLEKLRNLISGRPVGSSQVTAVVQAAAGGAGERHKYEISIRAKLVYPYFLRLKDPLLLLKTDQDEKWAIIVRQVWDRRVSGVARNSVPKTERLGF